MTTTNTTIFNVDVQTVARLLGIVVPILVALITKRYAQKWVKALSNILLSAVAGVLAPILAGDTAPHSLGAVFNGIVNAFIVSIVAYYGIFKPTGIVDALQNKTGGFGVGGSETPPLPPEDTEPPASFGDTAPLPEDDPAAANTPLEEDPAAAAEVPADTKDTTA